MCVLYALMLKNELMSEQINSGLAILAKICLYRTFSSQNLPVDFVIFLNKLYGYSDNIE